LWTNLLAEISASKFTGIWFTSKSFSPVNYHFMAEFSISWGIFTATKWAFSCSDILTKVLNKGLLEQYDFDCKSFYKEINRLLLTAILYNIKKGQIYFQFLLL
jgi:hypothetical protein